MANNPECIDLKERFGKKYRIKLDPAASSRSTDPWEYVIPCAKGEIYPAGGNDLHAWVKAGGTIAKEMRSWPGLRITQDATDAVIFRFDVSLFEKVAKRIGAKTKRHLSPEHALSLSRSNEKHRFSGSKSSKVDQD